MNSNCLSRGDLPELGYDASRCARQAAKSDDVLKAREKCGGAGGKRGALIREGSRPWRCRWQVRWAVGVPSLVVLT